MTISKKKFQTTAVEYDEARFQADHFTDLKKSKAEELVGYMVDNKAKSETFESDDGDMITVTLVAPESTMIDDDALKAILKAKRLTNSVYKPVTVVQRDDDALAALISAGKFTNAEVKKFSSTKAGTKSVRVTRKGK